MTKDLNDWDWYVGDPCYHIDNNRWDEFCNLLWKEENRIREQKRKGDPKRYENQSYISINHEVIIDWPILDDDGEELWTVEIEIWSSPYGDGCWDFNDSCWNLTWGNSIYVKGKDIPVDAGIIAIVPREAIKEDKDETMGLYFKGDRPTLETTEGDYEVRVNDNTHGGIGSCWQCGHEERIDQFYDCGSCFMCGPEEEEA